LQSKWRSGTFAFNEPIDGINVKPHSSLRSVLIVTPVTCRCCLWLYFLTAEVAGVVNWRWSTCWTTCTLCLTQSSRDTTSTRWRRSATLTWSSVVCRCVMATYTPARSRPCRCICCATSATFASIIDRTRRCDCASDCTQVQPLTHPPSFSRTDPGDGIIPYHQPLLLCEYHFNFSFALLSCCIYLPTCATLC